MSNFTINAVEGPLYDDELATHGAHFTQSSLYRLWQEDRGFTVERFVIKDNEKPILFFQAISAPLFLGKKQMYLPHGPVSLTANISPALVLAYKKFLLDIAKVRRAIFVRFDPSLEITTNFHQHFSLAPQLAYHSTLTQPRYEWILDISGTEEKLFASLPKDTRYSIRTAERRGAETKIEVENFLSYLATFYELMTETADRNGFRLHPKSYYEKVFIESEKNRKGFLVIVSFAEQPLVINLITIFGTTALHVFGGSSSAQRDKLPSYLAHWTGFLASRSRGALNYSFGGVAHNEDKKESWIDLTAFKKNFPGVVTDFGPIYDLPISRLWYYLYILGKIFRQK
ncbi:MAG: peptidoglycan bridge formation glycyltransferase FemA/FemB family protein [Patescibacteria group bacterium]